MAEEAKKEQATFYGKATKIKEVVEAGIEKAEERAEREREYNDRKAKIKELEAQVASLAAENFSIKLKLEKSNFGLPSGLAIHNAEALFRLFMAIVNGYGLRYRGFGGVRTIGKIFGAQSFDEEKKVFDKIKMFVFNSNRGETNAESDGSSVEKESEQHGSQGETAS